MQQDFEAVMVDVNDETVNEGSSAGKYTGGKGNEGTYGFCRDLLSRYGMCGMSLWSV